MSTNRADSAILRLSANCGSVHFPALSPRAIVAAASLLLASTLGLLATGCHTAESDARAAEPPPPPPPAPVAVRVCDVASGPVSRPIRGTGVVRLKSEADLSFKVGGVITALYAEEGSLVRRGQVLAQLDPTEVDAALRQAKEGATKADRDLERVKKLEATGSLPLSNLEDAETSAQIAHAGLAAAAFNQTRARLVAPDDGRIDRRTAEAGEIAAPGRPIFHLSGRSRGAVLRLGLTDRDVLRVHEGDVAEVTLDAHPDAKLLGKVSQIATVAQAASGTFDVEIKLDSPPPDMLSGLTAKVVIPHEERAAAVVPLRALVDGKGNTAAVFAIVDGRAKKIPVTVLFLTDARAALAALPLPPGARVVADGASELEDDVEVRLVP